MNLLSVSQHTWIFICFEGHKFPCTWFVWKTGYGDHNENSGTLCSSQVHQNCCHCHEIPLDYLKNHTSWVSFQRDEEGLEPGWNSIAKLLLAPLQNFQRVPNWFCVFAPKCGFNTVWTCSAQSEAASVHGQKAEPQKNVVSSALRDLGTGQSCHAQTNLVWCTIYSINEENASIIHLSVCS